MRSPLAVVKEYIQKRRRLRNALTLLCLSGAVRGAHEEIAHRTANGKTRRVFINGQHT